MHVREATMSSTTSRAGRIGRRAGLALIGGIAAGVALPAWTQQRSWRIGTTFDNSGVERANGSANFKGAQACFNALNKAGGIHGSRLELMPADDQFKPDVAKSHAQAFAADRSVIGLLSPLGTRQTAAIMESVKDLAIVGPITGTAGLRKASPPNLFWVRATYDQEVDRLIRTAATLGMTQIGIVHPQDPLGKSVLAAFTASMQAVKLVPSVIATTPGTTSAEVGPAVEAIVKARPQMVIMVLAGVVPVFVKALREAGSASWVYGLSIGASATNIQALGTLGRGIGFAIVVPPPNAPKYEIVRRYQADMRASGWEDFSLPSLEGYINARVMAEGLRRAGPGATREGLIAALEKIEAFDIGGLRINYGAGNRSGGSFVDVAVVGEGGRLVA
jgi:branched-chain amino acid transport system substrate-binding protein